MPRLMLTLALIISLLAPVRGMMATAAAQEMGPQAGCCCVRGGGGDQPCSCGDETPCRLVDPGERTQPFLGRGISSLLGPLAPLQGAPVLAGAPRLQGLTPAASAPAGPPGPLWLCQGALLI